MLWLWNALILLATVILMEIVAALSHKYIMHGWGWAGICRIMNRMRAI